ncbi:MAG: hypothetical protein AAB774_00245 [Patescibacteria group bacterium]
MARKSVRKLFLFGRYSLALLLPKKWLTELGVKRGESVRLELDRTRKRVVLRFGQVSSNQAEKPPASKKPEAAKSDNGLQPIPEL